MGSAPLIDQATAAGANCSTSAYPPQPLSRFIFSPRQFSAWLPLLCLLVLFAGTVNVAHAQPKVDISISGDLTESQRQNIRSHLSLARLPEKEPLSTATFHRLYAKVKKETATALEPFGYYNPTISVTQQPQNDRWQVSLVVVPGPPVLIEQLHIVFTGPGKEDASLQKARQRFPLQPRDILDHQLYEDAKEQLITVALDSGYLKASYRNNRVEIKRKSQSAVMNLQLETGPRYTFGPITFLADFINHDLLRKISPVQEGDPLTPRSLARLRQSLYNANYFNTVDLEYDLDQTDSANIPVKVILTPNLAHKYGVGLGYGTDTGPRGTLEYTNRYMNQLGHQLEVSMQPSQRKSNLGGVYTIPIGDPKRDRLTILGKYEIERYDSIDTQSWTSTISHDHFREQGEYSTYLQLLDEQYDTGLDSGHAALLIPGVKGSVFWADNPLVTARGLRVSASLKGSEESVLASTSFLQSAVRTKGIYSFFDTWRWIGRADLGTTLTDDIDALPPSLRYFAGGDQSVRGYGYKKIGPKDAEGNIVGGKNLLTYSLELERTLFQEWSAGLFYDSGTAVNTFSKLNLQSGAGVGVRWNAPFGQIRLDLAKALDDENNSWRIHFTMGADL
jgi:translocation and assembly module TamA